MRRFVLLAHEAATTPDFSLDDLPGTGGRMDLVARCVTSALLVSHGVRTDTEIRAVLLGGTRAPRTVRIVGSEVRSLNPDDRSTAALIRKALSEEGRVERLVHPGVHVDGRPLEDVIGDLGDLVLLDRSGEDVRKAKLPAGGSFILSDHRELAPSETDLLRRRSVRAISVGPQTVQSDQAIILLHNELDRRAATS